MSLKRKASTTGRPKLKRQRTLVVETVPRRKKMPTKRAMEMKTIDSGDVTTNNAFTTDNAAVILVNGVAQGTDYINRIGRRYTCKSILLRGYPNEHASMVPAEPSFGVIRVMIVHDKDVGGSAAIPPTLPVITDILATASVNSPNNLNNRDRFRVIADELINVSTVEGRHFHIYRTLNIESVNGGSTPTTAAITGMSHGAIYVLYIGQDATADFPIDAIWNCRVRFTD